MTNNIQKYIEIENRKFCVSKYPAKDGLKTARLIIAKLLPVFESFLSPKAIAELRSMDLSGEELQTELFKYLNIENITKALELISDDDFDVLVNRALRNTSEALPAGNAKILNENGAYGVEGIEYDYILTLRLVAESLIWSIGGFFDVSRLTSIMKEIKLSSPLSNAGM